MMAVFSCNNPEVKDFSDRFAVYSEDTYIKGLTKNLVYYLFLK